MCCTMDAPTQLPLPLRAFLGTCHDATHTHTSRARLCTDKFGPGGGGEAGCMGGWTVMDGEEPNARSLCGVGFVQSVQVRVVLAWMLCVGVCHSTRFVAGSAVPGVLP